MKVNSDTMLCNVSNGSNDSIKRIIKEKMIEELRSNLTIGMSDNDLKEYSEDEIVNFLNENNNKLDNATDEMFKDYNDDGELNDILTAPDDWFREYLYIHIDLNPLYGTQ